MHAKQKKTPLWLGMRSSPGTAILSSTTRPNLRQRGFDYSCMQARQTSDTIVCIHWAHTNTRMIISTGIIFKSRWKPRQSRLQGLRGLKSKSLETLKVIGGAIVQKSALTQSEDYIVRAFAIAYWWGAAPALIFILPIPLWLRPTLSYMLGRLPNWHLERLKFKPPSLELVYANLLSSEKILGRVMLYVSTSWSIESPANDFIYSSLSFWYIEYEIFLTIKLPLLPFP